MKKMSQNQFFQKLLKIIVQHYLVIPVGVTNIDDVHAIENVTLEPVNDHFDDMFQANSAWQKASP